LGGGRGGEKDLAQKRGCEKTRAIGGEKKSHKATGKPKPNPEEKVPYTAGVPSRSFKELRRATL